MWVKEPGDIPRRWEGAREKTSAIWREKEKEEEKKEAEELKTQSKETKHHRKRIQGEDTQTTNGATGKVPEPD
jgi:vacuolar-type H+-ATPase subunit H